MTYRYSLEKNQEYSFVAHNGVFWITFENDNLDYILNTGESFKIEKKKGLMLIQCLDGDAYGFEFLMVNGQIKKPLSQYANQQRCKV